MGGCSTLVIMPHAASEAAEWNKLNLERGTKKTARIVKKTPDGNLHTRLVLNSFWQFKVKNFSKNSHY